MRSFFLITILLAVAAACTNYSVTADALNIRKGAGTGYAVVRSATKGSTLCVDSIANGWARLSDGNYASSQYLTVIAAPAAPSCTNYVTTAALNIRTGAGTGYAVSRTAAKGSTLCVVSITSGWAKLNDGKFASADYLSKSGTTTPAAPAAPAAPSCTNYVTTAALNIRTGAGTGYGVVRTATLGSTLCVVSITSGWAKLNDGNYASADYLSKSGSSTGSSTATATSGSLTIAQKSSPNKSGRDNWKPDVIVCHITEGGYSGAVSWLCNPQAEASCHYVVSKKGEITQLVPLTESSWCQGGVSKPSSTIVKSRSGVNPNRYCIGIEHEGFSSECKGCLPEAQKQASGKLIKHIVNEVKRIYGTTIPIDRDHIIGHYEIDAVNKPNCPGANFPWADVIAIAKSA